MDRTDVVVVGAGLMGSSTARALGRRGVETLLLEQFELGHARGSSHGPTRIFRLSYPDPVYVRMAQRALGSWRELQDAAGERLLVKTGGLEAGIVAEPCATALEACGVDREWISPTEAGRRFPAMRFDDFDRLLYQADAGVCFAGRTVAAQIRLARHLGVVVRDRTPVHNVTPHADGVRIRTDDGEIEARVAVVTAGSWAGPLMNGGHRLQPILQQVSYFKPLPGTDPRLPTFIEWGTPEIVSYSLPPVGEAPGVKVGEHAGGTPVDPDDGPFPVDPERVASLAAYVERRYPGLAPEPVLSETCLYTMTPDEDFVLDRRESVVVGAGFSGHGFKFGPMIGEILADLATGRDPEMDLSRFRLDRPSLRA